MRQGLGSKTDLDLSPSFAITHWVTLGKFLAFLTFSYLLCRMNERTESHYRFVIPLTNRPWKVPPVILEPFVEGE